MPSHETADELTGVAPVVVVADDDPAILAATARICRKEGLHVVEASSGLEALDRVREALPDLVLLDVDLGDMDGRDACRTLRDERRLDATFFIMVSATAVTEADRVYGLEAGADGYITRPVSNDELRAWVRAYLRIQAAEKVRRLAEQTLDRFGRLAALGTLAGGVGHEIANPLMGVLGYVELILDEAGIGESVRSYAEGIVEEANRIGRIVGTMRHLGRTTPEDSPREVVVCDLIGSVVSLVDAQYREEAGIEIEVSVAQTLTCRAPSADAVYVLSNVLAACRQALVSRDPERTDPKCIRISATAAPGAGMVCITVADTGDGMDPRMAEHAFDPFHAMGHRTSDTGLQLAAAYRLARSAGGHLDIESALGQGTRYHFALPAAALG